jgi:hypothetical protein
MGLFPIHVLSLLSSRFVPYIIRETHIKALISVWAGRDLNPRTPPCQGGILTKLDHRPGSLLRTTVDSALQDLYAIYIAINQGHNINHTYNIKIKNYLSVYRLKTVNLIALTVSIFHFFNYSIANKISLMLL